MSVAIPLFPEGTRVEVRRGEVPIDPALVGRVGTVIEASPYAINSYGVMLDGDEALHYFSYSELKTTERPAVAPARREARGRLARP